MSGSSAGFPALGKTLVLPRYRRSSVIRAGYGSRYEGGFVHHYIGPLVYPRGMPRQFELVAGVSIVVWNGLVYACIYWCFFRDAAA
jgi:hypothetical protein